MAARAREATAETKLNDEARGLANAAVALEQLAKALAANGLWPGARLARCGLRSSSLCELCGCEEDTVEHRLWYCTAEAAATVRSKRVQR